MDEKDLMRKRLKARRALFVQPGKVESAQLQLQENLQRLAQDLVGPDAVVWSYMARGDEAPATLAKRTLAFPRIDGDHLEFFVPNSLQDMKSNSYGILEPNPSRSKRSHKPELIFVPGLGFDRIGGRIGSGKGFYDRVLSRNSKAIRVGVGYAVQISEELLPMEPHDQGMDWLVTENFILQCERRD